MIKMFSNVPPRRDSRELWKHFSDTYFSLRLGLAMLAIAMPFVLWLYGGFVHGLELQPSMSAYYWAAAQGQCATFPMRTIFVGFLLAIAVGLYLYKGLTPLENTLLNAAAICASLVAIYPERLTLADAASDQRVAKLFESCPAVEAWATLPVLPIHIVASIALFVLLACVAWFCAYHSLEYLPVENDKEKFRRRYRIIAVAMVLFPIPGLALAFVFGLWSDRVFFIEAAGIVTFGVYWSLKSRELGLSRLESDTDEAVRLAKRRPEVEAKQ